MEKKQTTAEKAKEIYGEIHFAIWDAVPALQSDIFKQCIKTAVKTSAIICVEQMIDDVREFGDYNYFQGRLNFLSDVKQEIEKM